MLDSFLDADIRDRIVRDVIRISMDTLFTEEEWKALNKQVEIDEKKYYDKLIVEGHAKGIEQGIEQVAKNLLKQNISIEVIELSTGLSKEQIEALK